MIRISALLTLAAPTYIALTFTRFYVVNPQTQSIIGILLVATGCGFMMASMSSFHIGRWVLASVAVIASAAAINTLVGNNFSIDSGVQLLANIGYAYAISKGPMSVTAQKVITLLLSAFFMSHAVLGVNPEGIFTISRNFISVLMILSVAFYYIACTKNEKSPEVLIPIFVLAICLWAIGRSGIISAALLLVGTTVLSNKKTTILAVYSLIAISVIAVAGERLLAYVEIFQVGIERFERLSASGPDPRELIFDEYFAITSTHLKYIFFGTPLGLVIEISAVGGNPHNAYISLHASFGMLGLTYFMLLSAVSLAKLWRAKLRYLTLVFLILLLRSAFDSTAFHGPLDVALFSCIFVALAKKRYDDMSSPPFSRIWTAMKLPNGRRQAKNEPWI